MGIKNLKFKDLSVIQISNNELYIRVGASTQKQLNTKELIELETLLENELKRIVKDGFGSTGI